MFQISKIMKAIMYIIYIQFGVNFFNIFIYYYPENDSSRENTYTKVSTHIYFVTIDEKLLQSLTDWLTNFALCL